MPGDHQDTSQNHPPARSLSLHDPVIRGIFYQILVIGGVVLAGGWLVSNTLDNLHTRSIATGFHFLEREASFAIGESLIPYHPSDNYGRALLVGLVNTLHVAAIGIVLATILGTLVGIARLSNNWLVAKLATVYVETVRNIPPLLQLFFWYALLTEGMPPVRQALNLMPGVFVTQRGLWLPTLEPHPVWPWVAVAVVIGVLAAFAMSQWAARRRDRTGLPFPTVQVGTGLVVGVPFIVWLIGGAPTGVDLPRLTGFNFQGGMAISPEFFAITTGLTIYTAAFIAEIVRSGIVAVNWGQTEAARALGLSSGQVLRLVVLPQALRVIVPPVTSQYLNLTKNTSLALAIGYPDLVAVANTVINQTGQAIEGVAVIMGVYLAISLSISLFMNWYNKKIALVER